MPTQILLSDLTNGSTVNEEWTGSGVFDVLIAAVNENIKIQYDQGRITGTDYANVYLASMQAVIAQSMQFLLEKKGKEVQVDSGIKQQEVMDSQIALYNRQKDSFDDNKYQKVLEAQMNYQSMIFGEAGTEPPILTIGGEAAVNDVFNKITGNDPNLKLYPE